MPEVVTKYPKATHYSLGKLIETVAENFQLQGHGTAPESREIGLALLNCPECLEPKQWIANYFTNDVVSWEWRPDLVLSAVNFLVSRSSERLERNLARAANSGLPRPNGISLDEITTLAEQTSRQHTWEKLRAAGFPVGHWREGLAYFHFYFEDSAELREKIEEWKAEVVAARIGATTPRSAKPAEIFATQEA